MSGKKWLSVISKLLLIILALVPFACCLGLLHFRENHWAESRSNLQRIGMAMFDYQTDFGRVPAAITDANVITTAKGPLYSWRVPLLLYLEHKIVYDHFRWNEAWDSPHNLEFLEQFHTPLPYRGDWKTPQSTHSQVFVGPGTAFEPPGMRLQDFPDGRGNTLLVVEAAEAVPWTKPADLAYDPAQPIPPLGGSLTSRSPCSV
jgi:hypothetical protein